MEARTKGVHMEKDLGCWGGSSGSQKSWADKAPPCWVQEIMGDIKCFWAREQCNQSYALERLDWQPLQKKLKRRLTGRGQVRNRKSLEPVEGRCLLQFLDGRSAKESADTLQNCLNFFLFSFSFLQLPLFDFLFIFPLFFSSRAEDSLNFHKPTSYPIIPCTFFLLLWWTKY